MAITREQFEQIVGKGDHVVWTESGLYCDVWNEAEAQCFTVSLSHSTTFQVRCGCFAIGIPCDWDAEVTFDRLMAIEGARAYNGKTVLIEHFEFVFSGEWRSDRFLNPITTMRQVHLLLAAAGVAE